MSERIALYDLTYSQLAQVLADWGEPRFRADQVWRWLYRSLANDYASMTNLPTQLRARLAAETDLSLITPLTEEESPTGKTSKVLFSLRDGHTIESVLMRYRDRTTACISTQVGCAMGCTFCATGQGGMSRNLTAGEIVAQLLYFARELRQAEIAEATALGTKTSLPEHPVTNVVLMGMGEPLANYNPTLQAIETLVDERGYNLGARQFTLSTVGLVPGIRRLAATGLPINLAVSLHAADDGLRNQLLPISQRYPLADLMPAVRDYVDTTGRRVTIEYALIDRVNDDPSQAQQLAALLHNLLCHVNLIPLNPTPGSSLRPSPRERVNAFRDVLFGLGISTTVRMRRGIDIEAGCGQLRQRQSGIAAS
jgi:23S rRNA (adenine2503-C2)-methyltransferase